MAVVTTITMPTAVEPEPGTFTITVEATLTDGVIVVGLKSFSQSISATTQAARTEVAAAVAGQIVVWRASVVRIASFAPALAAMAGELT